MMLEAPGIIYVFILEEYFLTKDVGVVNRTLFGTTGQGKINKC